jgi:VanZ family protein
MLVNIVGYIWNLYDQIRLFDEILHAFTTFALTLLVALLLYEVVLMGAHTYPVLFVLAVASLGMAMGTVWEITEWAYDQIVPGNVILGKNDTILDLILDLIGSVVAGIVSLGMIRSSRVE